jgi:hypothetical protein
MRTTSINNYTIKRKKGMPNTYAVYYKKNGNKQWYYGFCYTILDCIDDYIDVFKKLKGIE